MTTAIVKNSNERWANLIYRTAKIDLGFEFNRVSTSGDSYFKLFGREDAHLELQNFKEPKLVMNNGSTRRVTVKISEKDYEKLVREIKASPIEVRR